MTAVFFLKLWLLEPDQNLSPTWRVVSHKCAPGFEDLGPERARLRGFGPGARQASRIWAWSAPGFEDLGLERARLQGFGPGACQASRIGANKMLLQRILQKNAKLSTENALF